MMLSENQSKELLRQYGVSIPEGRLAHTPDEAERLSKDITARKYVVKAQIEAGGRGLAGGIKFAATPSAVASAARALLNSTLVTDQTAAAGETVHSVYVEAAIDIAKNYYVAISFDPKSGQPMLLASAAGGVEFEQLTRMDETAVKVHLLDTAERASDKLGAFLKDVGIEDPQAIETVENTYTAFRENDLTLVEINPFVQTSDGKWMAVDAKVALDRNASFRRPEFDSMVSNTGLSPNEAEAQKHNINFVQLAGNIGVVTNGAGLGLATNDMITDAGGKPANFMDIRTTARSFDVARGVELLLSDPQVQVLLLNIHGGGMTAADTVAEGVNFAYSRAKRKLPVVAHLAGHNAEWGISIVRDRNVPVEIFDTMSGAITRVVEIAGTGRAR